LESIVVQCFSEEREESNILEKRLKNLMEKLLLLLVLPVWAGCSSPNKDQKNTKNTSAPTSVAVAPEKPPAQRQICLAGLSKLSLTTPPEERAAAFLSACFPGCRPETLQEAADIDKWEKGALSAPEIIAACEVFCSPEAAASKTKDGATDWREVARVCGGEYYGLPIGQESLLTREWAALNKVATYAGLSLRTTTNEAALLGSVTEALKGYWIPMPIPTQIEGQYRLPNAQQSQPIGARLSLRVNKGRGFLGAIPMIKLTEKGAETIDIPGLSWPSDVTLEAMESKVAEGIATIKQSLGEALASAPVSTSAPSMMMKTPEKEDPNEAILYIADSELPVSWFVQVMKAIPTRSLRVAVSSNGVAAQLKARFEAPYENSNTAPTIITVTKEACLIKGMSPLPPTSLPMVGAGCDPEGLKAEITKAKLSGDRLSLVLYPTMTMSQFVTLLDTVSQLTNLKIWVSLEAPSSQPASTSLPNKP
jgi:hypothetical protein